MPSLVCITVSYLHFHVARMTGAYHHTQIFIGLDAVLWTVCPAGPKLIFLISISRVVRIKRESHYRDGGSFLNTIVVGHFSNILCCGGSILNEVECGRLFLTTGCLNFHFKILSGWLRLFSHQISSVRHTNCFLREKRL
jgi:hypothetical protein